MNISESLIEQFIAIAGFQCTKEDAEKYLKMSKGSIEIGLNYYFNKVEKIEKKTPAQPKPLENAFSKLKEGSVHQARLEKVIKDVKKNYYQPVTTPPKKIESTAMMPPDVMVSTDIMGNLERIKSQLKNSKFAKDYVPETKSVEDRMPVEPNILEKNLEMSEISPEADNFKLNSTAKASEDQDSHSNFAKIAYQEEISHQTPNPTSLGGSSVPVKTQSGKKKLFPIEEANADKGSRIYCHRF